jgi:hypothetical protein
MMFDVAYSSSRFGFFSAFVSDKPNTIDDAEFGYDRCVVETARTASSATSTVEHEIAQTIWKSIIEDAHSINTGLTCLALQSTPIWRETPAWWTRAKQTFAVKVNDLDKSNGKIWLDWYDPVAQGLPAFRLKNHNSAASIELAIALGTRKDSFDRKFWTRNLQDIDADISAWVREVQEAEASSSSRELLDYTPFPASYIFEDINFGIVGRSADHGEKNLNFSNQTMPRLIQKLNKATLRLNRTQINPYFPKTVSEIANGLSDSFSSISVGEVMALYRTWEACLAGSMVSYNLRPINEDDLDIPAILNDVQKTFDDFLTAFTSIPAIEATRLALNLQSNDVASVNQSLVSIAEIAELNTTVHPSAASALVDLQSAVQKLTEVIESSSDQSTVAEAIETRSRLVGQRTMTALNFTKSVFKMLATRISKGAADGLEKGVAETTEATVKLALISLASYMAGPLGALAAVVTTFKPFAKKADEINKSVTPNDIADT